MDGNARSGRILVIGSANMDLVALADRLPGAGETVAGREFRIVPGGKGANQAIAAARAGGTVAFSGAVGDDDFGRDLLSTLRSARVDTSAVAIEDVPTGTAHITVDRAGDNTIVVVPGANGTLTELRPEHRAAIDASSVLLLQLELPTRVVREAAEYASAGGVRVVLTPSPVPVRQSLPGELLAVTDLLVANEHEARILAGTDNVEDAVRVLAESCREVVMTAGLRGSYRARKGAEVEHIPAFSVEAVDTTAAGDTFVGVLAVGLAAGTPAPPALRRASAAAALSVRRVGASTSMPTAAEIDAFLQSPA